MAPIVALIVGKILCYLTDNTDEIIEAIREQFSDAVKDPEVNIAIAELGYAPSEERLNILNDLLEAKGEDTDKLASILVTKTIA